MGKGRTSASAKRRPADSGTNERADKETKENKQGKATTCQGQPTIQSCLNLSKSPRNNPFATILGDNSAKDASKPSEGKDADELNGPKQGDSGQQRTQTKPGPRTKGEKPTDRKLKSKESEANRKVTDYYPVRRSCRKSKAELKCEKQRHIDDLIKNNVEEGLKVRSIEGKGRGVFAERAFQRDQFVVEYHGDLIEIADAKARESQYAEDPSTGCYMYYFRYHDKTYCVDATRETNRLGRLINHSKNGNLQTKLHDVNGTPHLIFLASRDIKADEELLYDYGDRSKDAIAAHPWLKH